MLRVMGGTPLFGGKVPFRGRANKLRGGKGWAIGKNRTGWDQTGPKKKKKSAREKGCWGGPLKGAAEEQ